MEFPWFLLLFDLPTLPFLKRAFNVGWRWSFASKGTRSLRKLACESLRLFRSALSSNHPPSKPPLVTIRCAIVGAIHVHSNSQQRWATVGAHGCHSDHQIQPEILLRETTDSLHLSLLISPFAMSFGSPLMAMWANVRAPLNDTIPQVSDEEAATDDGAVQMDQEQSTADPPRARKRRLQSVSTKATVVKVITWMQEQFDERGGDLNLMADTVRNFPEHFRAESYTANITKAGRWWAARAEYHASVKIDNLSMSHTYLGARKRVELKARPGRGRKISDWCTWLYPIIRSEFDRLRKAGVKFSPGVLLLVAKNVLLTTPHPTYGPSTILEDSELPLIDRITTRWVQQFTETQGIVHRTQTGKLSLSPAKTEFIERSVAYHMGEVSRGFASGELNEDLLENMDETHFVVNMDNKKTLGFRGDKEVKYADVVSGGIGITLVVKVTGGRHGKICCPFLIFQNNLSSYPIRNVPDNVPGVCYRSSPSSFMTSELLTQYYSEPRVSWADPSGRTKVQFIDNYPGHNVIPSCTAALARIKTQLRQFPANSTHLTQPCDSFVISKLKDAWRRRWDAKKMEMIQNAMWQGDGRDRTSGALQNPGWPYFLQLAADVVRDVNAQVDHRNGISYARKAMIRCGLSLNLEGQWDVTQLTPELQEIILKYRVNFDGSKEGLLPPERPVVEGAEGGRGTGRGGRRGRGRRGGRAAARNTDQSAGPASDGEVGSGGRRGRGRRGGRGGSRGCGRVGREETAADAVTNQSMEASPVQGAAGTSDGHLSSAEANESIDVNAPSELEVPRDLWMYVDSQYNASECF